MIQHQVYVLHWAVFSFIRDDVNAGLGDPSELSTIKPHECYLNATIFCSILQCLYSVLRVTAG